MQSHIDKDAPYLALDLFKYEELKLTKELPVPDKKSARYFADRAKKLLSEANKRDVILIESTSSQSSSSRCSPVEFPY